MILCHTLSIFRSIIRGYNSYPPTMRHITRGHMFPDYEELTRDSPGSTVRLFILVVYFIVNVIVSAALILLVVLAPTRYEVNYIFLMKERVISISTLERFDQNLF